VTLRLTPGAEFDVSEALAWYRERGRGLGEQFLQALDERLESVQLNPLAYPKVHGDIRRALLRRFPYCVFYIIGPQQIVMLACLHGHRDPKV
jgi:plasmid stabilization system protein ParE